MSGEERQPNALMQSINSQSAAMQPGFQNPNQASPSAPSASATPQPQEQTAGPRVLVPDSSPNQNGSLEPGGFITGDTSAPTGNFYGAQSRLPPEAMLQAGRPDGAPPPKKRLIRFGDIERSQSPGDISINLSQSSSSDNISGQIQQFHILSQQNSASGSPAPGASPALAGPDLFLGGLQNGASPAPMLSATPEPAAQAQQQQQQHHQSQQPQQNNEMEFQRFLAAWKHLGEAQVRHAWNASNQDAGKATEMLCTDNVLLQGFGGSSQGASSAPSSVPSAPPPHSTPSPAANFMQMGQQPPPQHQQLYHPSAAVLPGAGPQQGYPRMAGSMPPQNPGMRSYAQSPSSNIYYPSAAAASAQQHMQQQQQQQQQGYPGLYRPPTQGQPQGYPQQQQPGYPQQQQQQHPGMPPNVQTRTVMPMPQHLDQQTLVQRGFDPRNEQHMAWYRNALATWQQQQGQGQRFGMPMAASAAPGSLTAQRQMQLTNNPMSLQNAAARHQQSQLALQQQALNQQRLLQQQQQHAHMQQQQQRQGGAATSKHAVSKLVAAHRPQTAPSVARKQKRKHADDDSDDDGGDYSEGDDGGRQYEEYVNEEKEAEALQFFNACGAELLPDYTACSPEAAQAIVAMRPFTSPDDIRNKLRKTKGVSNKLFDSCVDVFEAYTQVDRVFAECNKYGQQLAYIMRIWAGVSKQAKQQSAKSEEPRAYLLPGQTSAEAEQEVETGVHLVELDEAALELSAKPEAPPELQNAFHNYLRIKPEGVPEKITIKGYQMLGINWLNLLYSKRLSCILADEMGLGKTCQVITFLTHLKSKGVPGPHLIVVPSSTLDNWLREFDTFSSTLKVFPYYGSQAAREDLRRDLKALPDLDVIVTTYNMASGNAEDRKFLRKMNFKTCVYDEGHQLKNSESKKYKDLMELRVPWRLLLTGTPLQNNLTELISLLSFILPDTFAPCQDSLRAIFKVPPAAQANMLSRRRIEAAKRVMTPFVLRRKKHQVLQELPEKREQIVLCEMTDDQKALYRESMQKSKRYIMEAKEETPLPDEPAPKKGRGRPAKKAAPKQAENSSNILMDLRKAANHPMLFRRIYNDKKIAIMSKDCLKELEWSEKDPKYIQEDMSIMTDYELHRFVQPYKHLVGHGLQDQEWMRAGKVQWLAEHLPQMRERGDRVLLFSQFTQVLDLLEAVLDTLGIRYLKLTGQTNVAERQDLVDEFYEDKDITVFLLSTRAGGLGLNLAAANVVILHDQDFNPHNDKQAEDRAWRIGQTRDVSVMRLVMRDTIEEDILAMANTKLTLDSEISKIDGDDPTAQPGDAGIQEGEEGMAEKRVKKSLLKNIRAQLEKTEALETQQLADAAVKVEGNQAEASQQETALAPPAELKIE